MAEKIKNIGIESMPDMDDFIIEQLKKKPELIPELLREALHDLNSEDDNFNGLMKTLFYISE